MKFFIEIILKRHKKVIYKIKRIGSILLIVFIALASVASSFFVYPAQKAKAADCADPVAPEVFRIDKPELDPGLNEKLRYYVSYKPAVPAEQCKTTGVIFRIYIYDSVTASLPATGYTNYQEREGRWNEAKGIYEGGGEIETGLWTQFTRGGYIYAYVDEKGDGTFTVSEQVGSYQGFSLKSGSGPHQTPPDFPVIDTAEGYQTFALNSFGISITSLAKEYRIALDKPTEVNLRYKLAWEDPSKAPVLGSSYLDVNDTGNPDPEMRAVYAGYHYKGNKLDCLGGKVYIASPINPNCEEGDLNKSRGTASNQLPTPVLEDIKIPFDTIKAKITDQPVAGKPAKVSMMLFPIIDLDYSNFATLVCPSCLNTDKALSNRPLEVVVTIFATEEELKNTPCTESPDSTHLQECGGEVTATGTDTTSSADKDSTANSLVNFIAKVIGTIIWFINSLIFTIFAEIVLPLLDTLLQIRTYTDAFALVILPGWELLRNFANIFFIVVLLVIGMATLFRVQRYQYRTLLVNLILAALLVNFSLIITQSVVAVAETVQHQFLPDEEKSVAIRVIANRLMIAPLEQGNLTPSAFTAHGRMSDSLSKLIFPFFYLSLAIMAFVVMTSLVFFVLVRMLMIWVLLMTSPLAFVAWILPDTKKWSGQWFSSLIKYAFFVAIIGFFLNIAAYVAQKQVGILNGLYKVNDNASIADFLSRIATNIFVMGFLVAGIAFAQKSGVIGSKTLAKYAKAGGELPFKALAGAGKMLGGGALAVGKAAGNRVLEEVPFADPREWKKGGREYLRKAEERKAKRAVQRKLTGGLMGKVFGEDIGKVMANNEQFLENFGTLEGGKTLLNKIIGSKKFGDYKGKATTAQAKLEDVNKILTEQEREDRLHELDELQAQQGRKGKIFGKSKSADKIKGTLKEELDKTTEALNNAPRDSDKQKELKKKADTLAAAINAIESAGENDVINDTKLHEALKNVDEAFADRLQGDVDALKSADSGPDHQNRIDELEELARTDNERRTANGFDEYNTNPGIGYRKFTAEEKNKRSNEAATAQRAADSMDFKQVLKSSVESAKEQAKILQEWKEKGVTGEDLGALLSEIDAAKGKPNEADVLAAGLKKMAENGHTGQLLAYYGRDQTAEGYQKLMKELTKNAKMDEKARNALIASLDEIHKRNNDHGYGHMTERVGSKIILRELPEQQKAFEKAISNLKSSAYLGSPSSNFIDIKIDPVSGKAEKTVKEGAKKRLEAMTPEEAGLAQSQMAPAFRSELVNADGYTQINFQKRTLQEAKEKKKFLSVDEAMRQGVKIKK